MSEEEQPKYKIKKKLGSGAQGVVFLAERNGALFAIKKIGCPSEDEVNLALTEIRRLARLKHENLVEYKDSYFEITDEGEMRVVIVMPVYNQGDLDGLILEKRNTFDIETIVDYLTQISSALGFLHDNKIIHRDLKPANIFLTKHEQDEKKLVLKVGDFGLSNEQSSKNSFKTSVVGTPSMMAPEILRMQKYNHKVDIFSFGALIYKLLTGIEKNQLALYLSKFESRREMFDEVTKLYPVELFYILDSCLSIDPNLRPDFSEILPQLSNFKEEYNNFMKENKEKISKLMENGKTLMEAYHLLKKCNGNVIKAQEEKYSFDDFNDKLLIVGNTYRMGEKYVNWKLYFTSSDIAKVDLKLHDTFQPNRITLDKSPFELERTGWGTFDIPYTVYFKDDSTYKGVHDLTFKNQGLSQTINLTKLTKLQGKNMGEDHKDLKPKCSK